MKRLAGLVTNLFVVWVLAGAAVALLWPSWFVWFRPYINIGLGVVMFGMGLTLTGSDFRRVVEKPFPVLVGVAAQFLVMPLAGAFVAWAMRLPAPLAAGVILVGSCPGGTASNVMTYLARGDVALSVTLTSVSTLCSVVMTPLLVKWLAGQYVPVDAMAMLMTIMWVIILPVAGGVLAHRLAGQLVEKVVGFLPVLSVAFIVLIVACVVALSKPKLMSSGPSVFLAVVLHNGLGLTVGYALAWLARLDPVRCRTVAIEVGMQNSGLGVSLATSHFKDALVALPSAFFSVWHNVTGPALAGWWSRQHRKCDA
jgi:BASS family bile acid:Na+ symporter